MQSNGQQFPKLKTINVENFQNVYFCGDIHGRFDLLKQALATRKFDCNHDLLVLVGDLIDRGRYCPEVIDFVLEGLSKGYVAMVTGNHDHYPMGNYDYWMQNDGYWFDEIRVQKPERAAIILEKLHKIAQQPLAIELLKSDLRVGVVHGDVPGNCWRQLQQFASEHELPKTIDNEPNWQRTLLSGRSILKVKSLNTLEMLRVAHIDFVVSGHVVVDEPEFITNRAYIDTGAYCTDKLTVMSLPELLSGFKKCTC